VEVKARRGGQACRWGVGPARERAATPAAADDDGRRRHLVVVVVAVIRPTVAPPQCLVHSPLPATYPPPAPAPTILPQKPRNRLREPLLVGLKAIVVVGGGIIERAAVHVAQRRHAEARRRVPRARQRDDVPQARRRPARRRVPRARERGDVAQARRRPAGGVVAAGAAGRGRVDVAEAGGAELRLVGRAVAARRGRWAVEVRQGGAVGVVEAVGVGFVLSEGRCGVGIVCHPFAGDVDRNGYGWSRGERMWRDSCGRQWDGHSTGRRRSFFPGVGEFQK
jgi:hypothetical protein